jgi:hypothetical protein
MLGADGRKPAVDCADKQASTELGREAIEAAAETALQQSPYRELGSVSCHFQEGVLTLRGCVSSYYLKQVAQTLVRATGNVQQLRNCLRVESRST